MKATLRVVIALIIWGSLGVFVRNIDFPPMVISFYRAIIASIVMFFIILFTKKGDAFKMNKKSWIALIISAALIGFNWVLLFEAYNYTTIANATISYYMAPVIVIALSPVILKEKVTIKKVLIVLVAVLGLFLIMNSDQTGTASNNVLGVLLGLSAATLYATIVLINKALQIDKFIRVFIQLFFSAIILIPFIWNYDIFVFSNTETIVNLLILSLVHTALAYYLFYASFDYIKAQNIAILSFIDPLTAVILGAIVFRESVSALQIVGGVLILSGTFLSKE